VSDDVELGRRVADDFVEAGRCPAGAFDRHAFEVLLRLYPDEDCSGLIGDEHLEYRRERIRRLATERLAGHDAGSGFDAAHDSSAAVVVDQGHPSFGSDASAAAHDLAGAMGYPG
jgi:hypothetical protein